MSLDYSPIESYCKIPSWNTTHPHDDRRLAAALDELVAQPGFEIERLLAHIRANHAEPVWGWKLGELERVLDRVAERALRHPVTR